MESSARTNPASDPAHDGGPANSDVESGWKAGAVTGIICRLSELSVPDLARIELESNTPPWSERLFANEFSNVCSFTYGARAGGELLGFLVCHVVVDEAHIVNFAIAKSSRRNGLGRQLFTYVLRDLHARGVRWVTLEVRQSNAAARSLYESLGFQDVGIRRGYYPDNQEDGIVMSLNILHFVEATAHVEEEAVGR